MQRTAETALLLEEMDDFKGQIDFCVAGLRNQLKNMPVNMRLFSLSMRSLYVERAVGSTTEAAKKFRKLRDDTRNDAMIYFKGILPLLIKFVASISEYFEYYEALDYKEWCELLSDILDETIGYRELSETLVKMHEDFLVPLKKRKDEALLIATEFKELKEELEIKKKELKENAQTKRSWAIGLAFIPFVGAIAGPALAAAADSDLAEAVATGSQANIQEAAAITVSEVPIPALGAFIDSVREAAAFFSVTEQELRKFNGIDERSENDPKYLYYELMKKEARNMKSICQVFFAVLPDIRTDFLAIPFEGTDQNYIDKWLEKQKATIKENCKSGTLALKLLAAFTDGQ